MWWLACGAYDRDLRGRAFWMASFGKQVGPQDLIEMHPLRRMEQVKIDKPAEVREAESKVGWAAVNRFFEQQAKG